MNSDAIWLALVNRLLHPTQALIIEALDWIERPLSTTELATVFDQEELPLSLVAYHVRRLAEIGILEKVRERQVRGSIERYYGFASSLSLPGQSAR